MSLGVCVQGVSDRGVCVLGVSVQGVHVRGGGGGVLSCHRAGYGALACKEVIKNAYRKHSRLESKISLCVHTIYLMKINPAAYHPENAHN